MRVCAAAAVRSSSMAGEAEMEELQATLDHRSLLGMLKHVWYRGDAPGPPLPARHTPLKKVRPRAPRRGAPQARVSREGAISLSSRLLCIVASASRIWRWDSSSLRLLSAHAYPGFRIRACEIGPKFPLAVWSSSFVRGCALCTGGLAHPRQPPGCGA